MNDSKILITGKTGTVGSNLRDGIGFSSSEFDLRDFSETEKLIRKTHRTLTGALSPTGVY